MISLVPLLLLLGCAPPLVPGAEEPAAAPGAWEGVEDAQESDWAAPEAALQAVLDATRSLNARPGIDAYFHAMGASSPECPVVHEEDAYTYWFDRCRTDGGSLYYGYARASTYFDRVEADIEWTGTFYYIAAVIDTEHDAHFRGAATTRVEQGQGGPAEAMFAAWHSSLVGTITWDEKAAGDTWLADDQSPNLDLWARGYDDGERRLEVSGSVEVDDPELTAVRFDALQVARGWSACRVTGTVWLRGPGADWYRMDFAHGGADCAACADVVREDEVVGRCCADFLPLVAWEEAPW